MNETQEITKTFGQLITAENTAHALVAMYVIWYQFKKCTDGKIRRATLNFHMTLLIFMVIFIGFIIFTSYRYYVKILVESNHQELWVLQNCLADRFWLVSPTVLVIILGHGFQLKWIEEE